MPVAATDAVTVATPCSLTVNAGTACKSEGMNGKR